MSIRSLVCVSTSTTTESTLNLLRQTLIFVYYQFTFWLSTSDLRLERLSYLFVVSERMQEPSFVPRKTQIIKSLKEGLLLLEAKVKLAQYRGNTINSDQINIYCQTPALLLHLFLECPCTCSMLTLDCEIYCCGICLSPYPPTLSTEVAIHQVLVQLLNNGSVPQSQKKSETWIEMNHRAAHIWCKTLVQDRYLTILLLTDGWKYVQESSEKG